MKVKICGMTCLEDALAAVAFGADALGFIFAPESPRKISVQLAREIIQKLPPFVTTVGVFTNANEDELDRIMQESHLDMIQFHGDFEEATLRAFSHRAIQVVKVENTALLNYSPKIPARAILLDTYHKTLAGGSGKTFHWEIARQAASFGKIILAGGLTPDNVQEAIRRGQPYAVDVSSGVEAKKGKKDLEKMKRFIQAAKEMETCGAVAQ